MGLYSQASARSDTGDGTAGSGGAASVQHALATTFHVFYDVSATSDDLKVEGSTDGSTWRELDDTIASGSITTGGDDFTVTTGYEHIRVYAGSSFADSDVNTIELSAKGL